MAFQILPAICDREREAHLVPPGRHALQPILAAVKTAVTARSQFRRSSASGAEQTRRIIADCCSSFTLDRGGAADPDREVVAPERRNGYGQVKKSFGSRNQNERYLSSYD